MHRAIEKQADLPIPLENEAISQEDEMIELDQQRNSVGYTCCFASHPVVPRGMDVDKSLPLQQA